MRRSVVKHGALPASRKAVVYRDASRVADMAQIQIAFVQYSLLTDLDDPNAGGLHNSQYSGRDITKVRTSAAVSATVGQKAARVRGLF